MWRRKGGRFVIKVVCLWCVLGAYSFWKLVNDVFWPEDTESPTLFHKGKDGRHSMEEDAGNDLLSSSANRDTNKGWRQSATAVVSSRHLLTVLPNCTPRAVDQFPWDQLTEDQRKEGYLVLHVLLALYMFLALAIVCDRYFVPSLEILCELLNMQTDVAGATFMAAGSSAPELATAVIGVFIAKADVGLSTVVGSAIYNVMFVISMSALFATSVIQLQWWPLIRDCFAYLISVVALIFIIYDAAVHWYESVALMLLYVLYVCFMLVNERLERWCVPRVADLVCCLTIQGRSHGSARGYDIFPEPPLPDDKNIGMKEKEENGSVGEVTHLTQREDHAHREPETWHRLCEQPEGAVWTVLWAVSMPLSVVLFFTVPDCRRPSLRKLFWLSFIMSLFWLSVFCFLMVWMITVVGYTLNVPDSVMSLTFIAFGVSLPDVVSSVLVVRDGLGDMAMSNAIGSNVFDILVCLGLPWFLETCITQPGTTIPIYSEGLLYSSVMLLSTVAFLVLVTHLNGWQLTKKYGIILLVVYIIYTIMASLYELNVFGYFHPPECPSSY